MAGWCRARQPDGVFQYTPSDAGASPKLAWLNYKDTGGNDTGIPAFLPITTSNGLLCVGPNAPGGDYFPRPYGRLQTRLSSSLTDNALKIDTSTAQLPLPAPGTDIVVGNERMHVISVASQSNTLTVQRAYANTQLDSHPKNAPVMFTPLGILTSASCTASLFTCPYVVGSQVQMCLIPKTSGPLIAPPYTIIDIGDGWMTSNE